MSVHPAVGDIYVMWSGIERRIISVETHWGIPAVHMENVTGKNPGLKMWESLEWLINTSGATLKERP